MEHIIHNHGLMDLNFKEILDVTYSKWVHAFVSSQLMDQDKDKIMHT